MKLKVLSGAALWLALISLAHVWWNVGFDDLARRVQVLMGEERDELVVGFLPVT